MASGKTVNTLLVVLGATTISFGVKVFRDTTNPVGKPMPAFAMETVGGKRFTNRDVAGRVTLFYVCGEGCGACEAAGPTVTRIFDNYPEKRVAVVAGDAWNDDAAGAKALGRKLGVPTVVGIRQVSRTFRSQTVPFFVVLDRKGRVVFKQNGFGDPQVVEDAVNRALTQR